MKPHNSKSGNSKTNMFTNTAAGVFRLITAAFVLLNLFCFLVNDGQLAMSNTVVLAIASISQIILILIVEPVTYERHKKLNFTVNILVAIFGGIIFFESKNFIAIGIFLTSMVIVGLKMSITGAMILSFLYYGAYIAANFALYGYKFSTFLYNLYLLVILISTVYLCHYFSGIEGEKVKQDEAFIEMMKEKASVVKELDEKNVEIEKTYWDTMDTLIGIIEARDEITGGHSLKVCQYSVKLAEKMGLKSEEVSNIMKAAILHDIGKIGIPDYILLKPGPLTDEEYNMIMNHPEIGYQILSKINKLENILPMVLYHHERVDGKGYPRGLSGNKIPEGAKIIAVADSYDAMTSNRPYRKGLPKKEAKKRLISGAGTQFETKYVEKFIEILDSDNVDDIRNYRYMDTIRRHTNVL
jgi:uncharacterized domain HDIG